MADLTTSIAGVQLRNPTVLASGILGTTAHIMARVASAEPAAIELDESCPNMEDEFES